METYIFELLVLKHLYHCRQEYDKPSYCLLITCSKHTTFGSTLLVNIV